MKRRTTGSDTSASSRARRTSLQGHHRYNRRHEEDSNHCLCVLYFLEAHPPVLVVVVLLLLLLLMHRHRARRCPSHPRLAQIPLHPSFLWSIYTHTHTRGAARPPEGSLHVFGRQLGVGVQRLERGRQRCAQGVKHGTRHDAAAAVLPPPKMGCLQRTMGGGGGQRNQPAGRLLSVESVRPYAMARVGFEDRELHVLGCAADGCTAGRHRGLSPAAQNCCC